MKLGQLTSTLFITITFLTIGFGQKTTNHPLETEITYAEKMARVNMMDVIERQKEKRKDFFGPSRKEFKPPRNDVRRFSHEVLHPGVVHEGPDPVRQSEIPLQRSKPLKTIVNVAGVPSTIDRSPSDPSGDIGLNYYLQAVNVTLMGIFDKSGQLVETVEMGDFWANANSGGDPIILFDQEAHRWIVTEFPVPGFGSSRLLVSVSETDDPFGFYNQYSFSTEDFPDYPKYGIWSDAISVTTNEMGPGVLHSYFIDKEELYANADAVTIISATMAGSTRINDFYVSTPVDWSGRTRPPSDRGPIALAMADSSWNTAQSEDQVNVFSFDLDFNAGTAVMEMTEIVVAPYDPNPCNNFAGPYACLNQKDATLGVDAIPNVVMFQPHYRNFGSHESIVLNFVVDASNGGNEAGIRWMELRRTENDPWSVYQEGTFAPNDGLDRFMGSIAMDKDGNIGMAYSTVSGNSHPTLRYTGRNSNDPLGQMTLGEQVIAQGTNPIEDGGGRYGDYSHMTIDPLNDLTFWFTSEYAFNDGTATRILAFEIGEIAIDLAPIVLTSPQSSPTLSTSEILTVELKNFGLNPLDNYIVGYQVDQNPVFSETVNTTLMPDQTYIHTFSQAVDLSEFKTHAVQIFTSAAGDEQTYNDTLRVDISKRPLRDGSLTLNDNAGNQVCGSEPQIRLVLTNKGLDRIETASIEYSLDGIPLGTYDYTGTLGDGDTETIEIALADLTTGSYNFKAEIISINGNIDQSTTDNLVDYSFEATGNTTTYFLEILTDLFPEETSWSLMNVTTQEIVATSGGDLETKGVISLVVEEFCIDPDQCYEFIILDEYGDGFGQPSGGYEIKDQDGNILVSMLSVDFGYEESNYFCPGDDCHLNYEITVEQPVSGQNNGSILVDITGGHGLEFRYSINGGIAANDPIFENIGPGEYLVEIFDRHGCMRSELITLMSTSTENQIGSQEDIILYPNPTDGLIRVETTSLLTDEIFIDVDIYDTSGRLIHKSSIARYGDIHKGTISMIPFASGQYYVHLNYKSGSILKAIVKK